MARRMSTGLGIFVLAGLVATQAPAEALLPEVREQSGITYVTGGVGLDEREALMALGTEFSLALTFAGTAGEYLGAVEVRILSPAGPPVLEVTSDGPLLYVALPPGAYRVQATFGGVTLERPASVAPGRQTRLDLFWPSREPRARDE